MEQVLLAAADSRFAPKGIYSNSTSNLLHPLTGYDDRLPLVTRHLQHLNLQLYNAWLKGVDGVT